MATLKSVFSLRLFLARQPPVGQGLLIHEVSRSHTRWTTFGRTPLDEWSARCRDLYLTTFNTHNRQTSMPQVGFEPTISAGERPQTYAIDRVVTGACYRGYKSKIFCLKGTLFVKLRKQKNAEYGCFRVWRRREYLDLRCGSKRRTQEISQKGISTFVICTQKLLVW